MKIVSTIIKNIPIAFSFVLYVIGLIISAVPLALANYPYKIYHNFQLYRLLVTFLSKGDSVISIIAILVDFLLIKFFFTTLENKYSTVFFTFQILIQNLTFQIFFTLVAGILVYTDILTTFLVSYGWTPLIVIFVYKYAYKDRQQKFKLFCIQIPKKYIPFVIIILSVIFAFDQFICIALSIVFGYAQFGLYGRNFITLPLSFYKKIESCLPLKLTQRHDFKKIQDCEQNIKHECRAQKNNRNTRQKQPQVLKQQVKKQVSNEKKPKKQRRTGKNKNNKSGSVQFNQEIQSGKSTKDGDLQGMAVSMPNMQTNNQLNNLDKV